MSLISTATQNGRSVRHVLAMLALAVTTISLQVSLPWISNSVAKRFDQSAWGKTETWDQFLVDRFRFYCMFKPSLQESKPLRFQSAAVSGEELVVLFALPKSAGPDARCPMIRCHLKAGTIRRSFASPGIRHVVSDGQKIWWLPVYSRPISPFVWEGRPVGLVSLNSGRTLVQLIEFTNGQWTPTEQFVTRPKALDSAIEPFIRAQMINGRVVAIRNAITQFYYRTDLEFGTEAMAKGAGQGIGRAIDLFKPSALVDAGWRKFSENSEIVLTPPGSSLIVAQQKNYAVRSFSRLWFDQDQLWSLRAAIELQRAPTAKSKRSIGFLCENLEQVGYPRYFVGSPLRWELDEVGSDQRVQMSMTTSISNQSTSRRSNFGEHLVVTGQGDEVYVVNVNRTDGRIAVMQLVDQQARLIGETADPINWRCYLDVFVALMMFAVVPTAVLVLFARFIQRRSSSIRAVRAGLSVELASISRRSIARGIDLMFLGGGGCLAVAFHPGLLAWWLTVVWIVKNEQAIDYLPRSWPLFQAKLQDALRTFSDCFVIPIDGRLLAIVGLFFVFQVILQGRTGYTIGKWLVGIQAVGTTYRPPGIARSLLRELILIPESLGLLSWWPAVVAILSTTDRQRIGDLLADTVVIRTSPPNSMKCTADVVNAAVPLSG